MEDIWMRWSLKLSVELETGETNTYEVAQVDREEAFIAPASLGLSITESKQILAAVQTQMVTDQVARHNEALKACRFCGRGVRTKGYYGSVFKSVFGKVPMRLRRVWGCECRGAAHRTFSSIPTGKNPTALPDGQVGGPDAIWQSGGFAGRIATGFSRHECGYSTEPNNAGRAAPGEISHRGSRDGAPGG
jgi:hypothetical protein